MNISKLLFQIENDILEINNGFYGWNINQLLEKGWREMVHGGWYGRCIHNIKMYAFALFCCFLFQFPC